jgi:UDP-N-acetylmuramoylalanine--D-glutamate ligase
MKKLVILGSGESGTGAALLAQHLGYDVFVSDKGLIKEIYKSELDAAGIAWEEGTHTMERILAAYVVVKSPGIPEKTAVMQAVRAKGIEVIGEIELGWRYRPAGTTVIGITGSNGKTTTTNLMHHLLSETGFNTVMGGNIGYSFARLVLHDLQEAPAPGRIYTLEVSSFQLDDTDRFQPDIAMLLNITPDHLDRYEYQMTNYVRSKFRVTRNQAPAQLFITNGDDPEIQGYRAANPDAVHATVQQVYAKDLGQSSVQIGTQTYDLSRGNLRGPHNMFNAACALRAALYLGVSPVTLRQALDTFVPPPHRLEKVDVKNGITYINDSKATNVDSVFYALKAMTQPTVWIVGGQDKGNDYTPLMPLVAQHVKAIVCMGLDNSKIIEVFAHLQKPTVETRSAAEAVRAATAFAAPGDTVLLSPACASFDLFENYEDRGNQFRKCVIIMND